MRKKFRFTVESLCLIYVLLLLNQTSTYGAYHSKEKRSTLWNPASAKIYNFSAIPLASIKCNLQNDLCGWKEVTGISNFGWKRQNGLEADASGHGLSNDFTYGNKSGYYLIANFRNSLKPNYFADLISPPMLLPKQLQYVKVKFAYNTDISILQIYAIYPRYNLTQHRLRESIFKNHSHQWYQEDFTFLPLYPYYQIIIRSITNAKNILIALDDLEIYPIETNCYTDKGQSYRGNVSITRSGILCQQWSSNTPHNHSFKPSTYYNDGLVSNYCRNPSGLRNSPWCYTSNSSISWQYCNVTKCQNSSDTLTYVDPYKNTIPIKLVGESSTSGRVVVYHEGEWGTVCNDLMNDRVATVICRQLGLPQPGKMLSTINEGTGTIWIRLLICIGNEKRLENCLISSWNSTFCNHSEDAVISCSGKTLTTTSAVGYTATVATTKPSESRTAVPFVLISASFFVLVILTLIYIRNARRSISRRNQSTRQSATQRPRMVAPPSYNTALNEITRDPNALKELHHSPTGESLPDYVRATSNARHF
ncbi:Neurotrypsin [Trichoplax sp. H2]|nr:Neurotrypsin [Trichoplax sp. H2]|eukprot:RDD37045.1 Neurotrypsin [Trichoplax sp. H2]